MYKKQQPANINTRNAWGWWFYIHLVEILLELLKKLNEIRE